MGPTRSRIDHAIIGNIMYRIKYENLLTSVNALISEGHYLQCDKCDFKTAWKRSMKRHQEEKHADNSEGPSLHCDQCGLLFLYKRQLTHHKR